jgi:putative DNA primase/helicase
MTTLSQALEQMLAAGMPHPPDGGLRVNTPGVVRYGPKRRAWYRLFEHIGRNGRGYISGAFGLWGRIESMKIESDYEGMDADERARMERERKALEAREATKRDERAANAANRARLQWRQAVPCVSTEYLLRKQVAAEKPLRAFGDGTLVVPMWRIDAEPARLVGLQKIAADGEKRFNKGMSKAGSLCVIGAPIVPGQPVLVAEGVATALSIRAALDRAHPVVVAFDAGNLLPAAQAVRKLFPDVPLLFCADDDYATEGNPGQAYARRAADDLGRALIVVPEFKARPDDAKWTDFNDLQVAEGVAAVGRQVTRALKFLAKHVGGAKNAARTAAPAGGKGASKAPPDWDTVGKLLERFTLVYPSQTAFDAQLGELVRLEDMRSAFGRKTVELWQMSPARRTVLAEHVVFDPMQRKREAEHINLFRGLSCTPRREASCELLLELMYYLCGRDDELYSWVMRWAAYPLQHVGAKMASAIVMYGKEGTGKNMFWGAVRNIYGRHGGIITQQQLQSQFNGWMSAKLFVLANEVVTRQELRHHVGMLKNLITEPEVWINRKMVDERHEANHMNVVFLSNELQPLQISPDDRRYQVIRTPAPQGDAIYRAVAAELDDGGVEALYAHLLALPLGDFTPHTKPLMTEAKAELAELGLSSAQLFWSDLHDGRFEGLPYAPCLSEDLYRAYQIWCHRYGEKMPLRINRFSADFKSLNGVKRLDNYSIVDPSPEESTVRKRRVFVMGDRPDQQADDAWIKSSVSQFRVGLDRINKKDGAN